MNDISGAGQLLHSLPKGEHLVADRGYDARWLRDASVKRGVIPCIPPIKNRKARPSYDAVLYRKRHKIENMFFKLKDWRRIAMRYD
ncbi:MAG: transposase, partial [Puniceicoccales bacterium]|nr:transposase [Puniceicoccales bacterium]